MAIQTKTKNLCFLDQDGVIADFVGGACAVHGRRSPFAESGNLGEFELIKLWGCSEEEFWGPIDDLGCDFWVELSPTREAREIVDLALRVFGQDNVAVLTAPSSDPGCVPGKRAWMKRHFPELERRIIFANASNKHFLAGPGRYLIDDRDSNVEQFTAAGGIGILVPRPWNKLHGTDAVVESVAAKLFDLAVRRVPVSPPVQSVPCDPRGAVRHWPVAGKAKPRGGYGLSFDSSGRAASVPDQAPARGRERGVPGDDYCLLCCAFCGAAYNSRFRHQCHPDGPEAAGGPQC